MSLIKLSGEIYDHETGQTSNSTNPLPGPGDQSNKFFFFSRVEEKERLPFQTPKTDKKSSYRWIFNSTFPTLSDEDRKPIAFDYGQQEEMAVRGSEFLVVQRAEMMNALIADPAPKKFSKEGLRSKDNMGEFRRYIDKLDKLTRQSMKIFKNTSSLDKTVKMITKHHKSMRKLAFEDDDKFDRRRRETVESATTTTTTADPNPLTSVRDAMTLAKQIDMSRPSVHLEYGIAGEETRETLFQIYKQDHLLRESFSELKIAENEKKEPKSSNPNDNNDEDCDMSS